jgi:RND family efflux transporter MFP subunit
VSQVDKLRVHIPVPEADAALVNQGDAISLSFPSFPGEAPMTVSVTRVSGSLDPSTRTMLVEAEIPNPDGKLLPGMFGQASIVLTTKVAANMLPARAVRFDESGRAFVYVVDQADTVSIVDVTTGFDDGLTIEILSGVDSGQRVVDAHLNRFTTGQQVQILTP